ncbi:unnamed protein product [Ectocarpus sp. 4 AP-2014]
MRQQGSFSERGILTALLSGIVRSLWSLSAGTALAGTVVVQHSLSDERAADGARDGSHGALQLAHCPVQP